MINNDELDEALGYKRKKKKHKKKKAGFTKFAIYGLVKFCALIAISGVLFVFGLFYYYAQDLPDHMQLAEYNPPIVTRFYSNDSRLLEEYAKEHRLFIPIKGIPKRLINAFLAAEDKNFYEHPGIDFQGLIRAIFQNLLHLNQNRSLVGGSTITQQVVKNFLLTNEKSLSRKIKEAILSFRISKVYSKDRILELYLNQIYLGSGSYGVASASLNYFNKSIDELDIEEVAMLASLPKAPSFFDPRKNYVRAKERRDWVIGKMAEHGFITTESAEEAMSRPIILRKKEKDQIVTADFFAETVRKEVSERYGSDTLYSGGLFVKTTLDPKLQEFADIALRNGLVRYDRKHGFRKAIANIDIRNTTWNKEIENHVDYKEIYPWEGAVVLGFSANDVKIGLKDKREALIPFSELSWTRSSLKSPKEILQVGDIIVVEAISGKKTYGLRQIPEVSGGIVVMDPHTGKILAMSGGYYYGKSQFNRAVQAKRQPGSVYKPFVYLSALESGYTPSSIILDGPVELSQGAGLPVWRPKNYSGDFLGPTPLRRGVELSRNAMTVRLAQALGIKKIMEVTKRFGINEDPQRNFSIVLGAMETTLVNMTNAYAIVVNGGKKIKPTLIERIDDRNGVTIYKRDNSFCDACVIKDENNPAFFNPPNIPDNREIILDERTAYQMTSILEGVVERGTARRAKALNHTLGGKTGTTNDSKDAWFIGFTPDLVVGTYIGYDNPRSLGKKETGASVALPIFINFMEHYLKGKENIAFRVPEGIKLVKTNSKSGRPTSIDGPDTMYEAYKVGTEPQYIPEEVPSVEATEENGEGIKNTLPDNIPFEVKPKPSNIEGIY